jgi:hypothetical protein
MSSVRPRMPRVDPNISRVTSLGDVAAEKIVEMPLEHSQYLSVQ